ncbi:response regulator [Xinfangfangia sp. D13-10-4-6]|uniref:response regulator n=1 Tax=Pseudogemmobacter hezensis TaxID=2737662 RepID=UPI001554F9AE|nr:response regulator [Pseudogemmobacter hezensis]NPD15488.1 response regulator [Pseudogemmobacter hezensis]
MSPRPPATPVMLPAMVPGMAPTIQALPLRGLTLLIVEDSRFASEALRLMCQRSGARIRRADSLGVAASHLGLYRPDVVIIDLGLPDGRGEDLIRGLCRDGGPVVLGMSGDENGAQRSFAAGAVGFLGKPLPDLAGFQAVILSHLGDREMRSAPFEAEITPDPLALRDDLRLAEAALANGKGEDARTWLQGFLAGLALQSGDPALKSAADAISSSRDRGQIRDLISEKIRQMPIIATSDGLHPARKPHLTPRLQRAVGAGGAQHPAATSGSAQA